MLLLRASRAAVLAALAALLLATAPSADAAATITNCPNTAVNNINTEAGQKYAVFTHTFQLESDVDAVKFIERTNSYNWIANAVTGAPRVQDVSITLKDSTGASATCSYSIRVLDPEPPKINCPTALTMVANQLTEGTIDLCDQLTTASGTSRCSGSALINATDNVGIKDIKPDKYGPLLPGNHTIVFSARDLQGNPTTCSVLVTLTQDTKGLENQATAKLDEQLSNLNSTNGGAALNTMAELVGLLTPADTATMNKVAEALNLVSGGQLTSENMLSATSTATTLGKLRRQQLTGASSTCGDATCHAPTESCTSCPADCGVCAQGSTSLTAATSISVNARWQRGAVGFGTVPATVTFDASALTAPLGSVAVYGLSIGDLRSNTSAVTLVDQSAASVVVVDPVETAPAGTAFAGVSLLVSRTSSGSLAAPTPFDLALDVANFGRTIRANVGFHLLAYDPATGTWKDPSCTPAAGLPINVVYDASAATVTAPGTAGLCLGADYRQLALFANSSAAIATLEENLAGSMGQLLASVGSSVTNKSESASVGRSTLDVVNQITGLMVLGLSPDEGASTLENSNLLLVTQAAPPGSGSFKVGTDKNISVDLPSALRGSGDIGVALGVLKKNPFAFSNSSADIGSAVVEVNLFGAGGSEKKNVSGLSEPVVISIATDQEVEAYKMRCQFWDDEKETWSTEGVQLVVDDILANISTATCQTTHFSSFSVGINFQLEPPSISLSNFDPSKSWIIYTVFGSMLAFLGILAIYSWYERRRYDQRQLQIEQGIIEDDEVVETLLDPVQAAPTEGLMSWFCCRVCANWCSALKTDHSLIASVWPTGRKVYPKRMMKVWGLLSALALAAGLDAVFAYAAHVDKQRNNATSTNINSVVISGTKIPLDGLYAFLIMLPALILLSLALGTYSAYMDVLRKVAPRRFRALTPKIRMEMERRGIPATHLTMEARKRHIAAKKLKQQQARREKRALRRAERSGRVEPGVPMDHLSAGLEVGSDEWSSRGSSDNLLSNEPAAMAGKAIRQSGDAFSLVSHGSRRSITAPTAVKRSGSLESLEFPDLGTTGKAVAQDSISLDMGGAKSGNARDSVGYIGVVVNIMDDDQHATRERSNSLLQDVDAQSVADSLVDDEEAQRARIKAGWIDYEQKSKSTEDLRLLAENEFSEDVEELVDKMNFWKRVSIWIGVVLFLLGTLFTFFWVGSLDTEDQRRWVISFALLEGISNLISAPLFILIGSAITAWKQQKKLEEEQEDAELIRNGEKLAKEGGNTTAKDDAKDEIKSQIAEAVHQSLFSLNFF